MGASKSRAAASATIRRLGGWVGPGRSGVSVRAWFALRRSDGFDGHGGRFAVCPFVGHDDLAATAVKVGNVSVFSACGLPELGTSR